MKLINITFPIKEVVYLYHKYINSRIYYIFAKYVFVGILLKK
jgi:hypothetical protein